MQPVSDTALRVGLLFVAGSRSLSSLAAKFDAWVFDRCGYPWSPAFARTVKTFGRPVPEVDVVLRTSARCRQAGTPESTGPRADE